ncbi:MAG: type II toxin-antitoxin system death-on-curing family toxin [Pseudomonadales bacterium]|nr:type II toxin-antitoxin system death-on-curing family toxin [Pseudomonadales bacterium]
MKEPGWVLGSVIDAVHTMLLAEHGGGTGTRDKALLGSAVARAQQKVSYEPDTSIFLFAAAYSYGIAKNHPFVDGNKRTAFTVGTLFLELNGYMLNAPEANAALIFEQLAAGQLDELELARWFELHSSNL